MRRESLVRARRRLVGVILTVVLALFPRTFVQSNPDVLSDSVSLQEWGRCGNTSTVRSRPSCSKVGERPIAAANPPTGLGPAKAGSFNVCRRGEPSGWRQPKPDLDQVRGPLENPAA